MGAVDRSVEFFHLLQEESRRLTESDASVRPLHAPSSTHAANNVKFSQLSDEISKSFDKCYTDLGRLRQLANQQNLFDDQTTDIEDLTFKIKQAMLQVQSTVDSLEEVNRRQFSNSGSPGSQHAAAHRNTILKSLRTKFMDLTKEFKDVLELRTTNLKHLESRRGYYGQGISSKISTNDLGCSSLMRRAQNGGYQESTGPLDLEAGVEDAQTMALAPGTTYHQSRVEAVEQIQRVVGELSTMFSRVAMMVGQQEELVMRIDATVDESLHRLKEGQAHLLKYFHSIVNQRSLILKLLGMILAFALFFIVFLA